jgi:hypothetical protein
VPCSRFSTKGSNVLEGGWNFLVHLAKSERLTQVRPTQNVNSPSQKKGSHQRSPFKRMVERKTRLRRTAANELTGIRPNGWGTSTSRLVQEPKRLERRQRKTRLEKNWSLVSKRVCTCMSRPRALG